jgi:protein-arginine kinase activator protein McsA
MQYVQTTRISIMPQNGTTTAGLPFRTTNQKIGCLITFEISEHHIVHVFKNVNAEKLDNYGAVPKMKRNPGE